VKRIPDDDLLDAIRDLNEKTRNTPPTRDEMDDHGQYYGRSYRLRFGSWNEAVAAAGFEPRDSIDEEFVTEPDSCPLCGDSDSALDFHHWRYGDRKQGCYFCRECHDTIHDDGAQPSTDSNWLIQAVTHLVERHFEHHGRSDPDKILARYNVTSVGLVEHAIDHVASGSDQANHN